MPDEVIDPDKPLATLPAIYSHCCNVYKEMESRSEIRSIEGVDLLVYEGALTRLFTEELNLSVPYYTSCLGELKRMRCLEQLRRGGGGSPSVWVLHYAPSPEIWRNTIHRKTKTKQSRTSGLEGQVADLNKRLNKVEVFVKAMQGGSTPEVSNG